MAGETQKLTLLDIELGARARVFETILAEMNIDERATKAEDVVGALNDTCTSYAQQRVFATVVDPLVVEGEIIAEALRAGETLDTIVLPGTLRVDAEFEQFVFVDGEKNWGIHAVLGEVAVIHSSIIELPKRKKFEAILSSAVGLQQIMRAA